MTETETYLPKRKKMNVPDNLRKVDNPSFAVRTFFTGIGVRNPELNSRHRMSTPYCYGGNNEFLGGNYFEWSDNTPHTMLKLLPYEKYGKNHPEWFSRQDEKAWPCLTNGLTADGEIDESIRESVLKTVVEELKKKISENEKTVYFVLGQPDNDEWCQCEKCRASYKKYDNGYWDENMGITATVMVFVNRVAEEIDKWAKKAYPGRKYYIVTLSYRGTLHPPIKKENDKILSVEKAVKPRKNVMIYYCASGGCQTHKLGDESCFKARRTAADLEGWKALKTNLIVYDYATTFNNTLFYYPYRRAWQYNLLKYKEYGATGILRQALHIEGKNFDALFMQYLCSEFFWNVNTDFDKIANEFYRLYFGSKIAPYIREYFSIMENAVYSDERLLKNIHSAMYIEEGNMLFSEKVFTEEVLTNAIAVLKSADMAVNNLTVGAAEKILLKNKICSVAVQPKIMLLAFSDRFGYDKERKSRLRDELYSDMKNAGIVCFSEDVGQNRERIKTAENFDFLLG